MVHEPKIILDEIDWNDVSDEAVEEIIRAAHIAYPDYSASKVFNPEIQKGIIIVAHQDTRLAHLLEAGVQSWLIINRELPTGWPNPKTKGQTKISFAHIVQI